MTMNILTLRTYMYHIIVIIIGLVLRIDLIYIHIVIIHSSLCGGTQ
jgi:hypothetical protein